MADAELTAEQIDVDFVPVPVAGVSFAELEGELVLTAPLPESPQGNYDAHWLDGTGAVVWKAFDGSRSIEDVADLLSEGFDADPDVVREDVLALVRKLGQAGLFEGVKAAPQLRFPDQPEGLPVGTPLDNFRLHGLDGPDLDNAGLHGRLTVLVNWSPSCGYCIRMADSLAAAEPSVAEAGSQIWFLTHGDEEANRGVRDGHGLTGQFAYADGFAPFAGLGTPSAYLIDESGRTASPLASGATGVMELVRRAAAES
ncbi:MAG: PqqD family peptide modification chaperone [Acidimicrobiales bacterium]|nr:PqqD family peptide modification chaperone [Acidimicrobiales bacterium]